MELELKLHKRVRINIDAKPYYKTENTIWFGFPVADNLDTTQYDSSENLNNVSGYFLFIHYSEKEIIIGNDISGGFRVYVYENEAELYISDNYLKVIDILKQYVEIKIDKLQFDYWVNHRYTLGDRTYVKNLNKLPPHNIWKITEYGINKESYFQNFNRSSNPFKHKKEVLRSIKDLFNKVKSSNPDSDFILLFSGGKDSRYLAKLLQSLSINFVPVFFYSTKPYKQNFKDLLKARNGAETIGVKLIEIEIDIEEAKELLPQISSELLFDRHFALLHYAGMKKLNDSFSKDSIVINGQSSDNVFSFGPSENTIGSFFQRFLIYFPYFKLVSYIFKKTFEYRNGVKYRLPSNTEERLLAFTDETNYIFLLKNNSNEYMNLLKEYVKSLGYGFSFETQLMMLRISTYLQGSDNQVAIKSAKYYGFNKVILPFIAPRVIYSTLKFKSNIFELIFPKYVVKKFLKINMFLFFKKKHKEAEPTFTFSTEDISKDILEVYKKRAESLIK